MKSLVIITPFLFVSLSTTVFAVDFSHEKPNSSFFEETAERIVAVLPRCEIVLIESRVDEWRRVSFDNSVAESFSWKQREGARYLNALPLRFLGQLKGASSEPSFNSLVLFYLDKTQVNPGVLFFDTLSSVYNPSFISGDGFVKMAFVTRSEAPWNEVRTIRTNPESARELDAVWNKDNGITFLSDYDLSGFFPDRCFKLEDNLFFLTDIPQPDMPDTRPHDPEFGDVGEREYEKRMLSCPKNSPDHPQFWSRKTCYQLSRQELSELVFLAYWNDGESNAAEQYEKARDRHSSVLMPVSVDGLRTQFGKTLRRKIEEARKAISRTSSEGSDIDDWWNSPEVDAENSPEKRKQRTEFMPSYPGGIKPGWGTPGSLLPCKIRSETEQTMSEMGLVAGVFKWPSFQGFDFSWSTIQCPSDEISYLLYVPRNALGKKLPMLVFFCGQGEFGETPDQQFRQPDLYRIVTDPAFQKIHPCILFAPVFREKTLGGVFGPREPSVPLLLACDAMYAVIKSLGPGTVDTNRLYATGLSFGGDVALDMLCAFPGRFAAAIPVSASEEPGMFPDGAPTKFWLLHNQNEYSTTSDRAELDEIRCKAEAGGGEIRESVFPETGHDAWRAAWAEPAIWNWLFNQTADGRAVSTSKTTLIPDPGPNNRVPAVPLPICSASVSGRDAGHGPERGADQLEATAYVSARPVSKGDWWKVEFLVPVSGRIEVWSGFKDGANRISAGRIETSSDGCSWTRRAAFSRKTGKATFSTSDLIRFIRVLPEPAIPELLVIREVVVRSR